MQFTITIDNTLCIVAITNRTETLTICIINTEWTGFMLLNGLGGLANRIGAGAEQDLATTSTFRSLIGCFFCNAIT